MIKRCSDILLKQGNGVAADVVKSSKCSTEVDTIPFAEYGVSFVGVIFRIPKDLFSSVEPVIDDISKQILNTLVSIHTDNLLVKIVSVKIESEEL